MNKIKLKSILDENKINPMTYSLSGGLNNDTICIEEIYGKWHVYYTERGEKFDEKIFNSASEACEYFLNWILKTSNNRL
jgi:hypothetical protein